MKKLIYLIVVIVALGLIVAGCLPTVPPVEQGNTGNLTKADVKISPGESIQAAIDAAASGDTILVTPGTYYEVININKSNITIVSEAGPEKTIIDAEGTGNAIVISGVNGVTLEGFTVIRGGRHPLHLADTEGIVLANNIIDLAGGKSQAYATRSNKLMFRDSTVENCYGGDSSGFNIQDSSDCSFVNNLFQNNGRQGLSVTRGNNTDISNNIFKNNGQCGMKLNGDKFTIENNVIRDNGWGIWIQSATNSEAHYNNIVDNEIGVWADTIIDAIYNWWGDATGPYHPTANSGGLGDAVSDNVDFFPWLESPYSPVIEVEIDIKPGSDSNSINLSSKGVIPVAVLTTDDFDAKDVDPNTVSFAGASPVRWTMEDVDGDGDFDMLFHFKTQELVLDEDSTEATLTGVNLDGIPIEGTNTVKIVPKK